MTLEESKEVIPMMEAMITQIEGQQNIMAEMLQEIQEKDEKLMCFLYLLFNVSNSLFCFCNSRFSLFNFCANSCHC